jgi:hypothetical protein
MSLPASASAAVLLLQEQQLSKKIQNRPSIFKLCNVGLYFWSQFIEQTQHECAGSALPVAPCKRLGNIFSF